MNSRTEASASKPYFRHGSARVPKKMSETVSQSSAASAIPMSSIMRDLGRDAGVTAKTMGGGTWCYLSAASVRCLHK
jgi:hypothetical protein